MNNEIQLFNFGEVPLRVLGTWDEPWFVAKDVCDALGIVNGRDAVSALDDDEKNTVVISDGIRGRGNPNINVVSESGLYSLVFQSRKPEAKAFRRWVTREVLPAIRKTGSYSAVPPLTLKPELRALQDVLLAFLESEGGYRGTGAPLHIELSRRATSEQFRDPDWPRTVQQFGVSLGRLEHVLESRGFEISRGKSGGRRMLRIRRRMQSLPQ